MLNSHNSNNYNKTIVSNHVNAVTGNITKTYAKSFFRKFHLSSKFADKALSNDPYISTSNYSSGDRKIQVIQMVICGDMEVMAEIMFQEDYDAMLEAQSGGNGR